LQQVVETSQLTSAFLLDDLSFQGLSMTFAIVNFPYPGLERELRGARTVVIFGTSKAWRARQFESIRLKSYKPTVFIFSQSQKERNANFIKAHVSIQSYHLKQQLLSKSTSRPSHGNYNVFSFFPPLMACSILHPECESKQNILRQRCCKSGET